MKCIALTSGLLASSLLSAASHAQEATQIQFAKIYSVAALDANFTFAQGEDYPLLIVSASGFVNTDGWSSAELGGWSYIQPPSDGVLDFDFIARTPPPGAIVTMAFQPIEAGLVGPVPPWVKGVRVHASTNEMVVMLDAVAGEMPSNGNTSAPSSVASTSSDSRPVPWPFPWYTPDIEAPAVQ